MTLRLDLANYGSCPQYNQWLDERYLEESETLNILGFQPKPSLVLYSLSQDTYQAAFDDFKREWEEELKDSVFEEFPSPIAHYFYRFENGYENALQRLHFLRDTWEAVVDVLHAFAVSECSFRAIPLPSPMAFVHFLSDSVAQRLQNIERIVSHAKDHGIALEIFKVVSPALLTMMRELNQTRNAFSHSAAQSESQALAWIGESYEEVLDILDGLRPLSGIEIVRYLGQIDHLTLKCEVFRGHGFTKTIRNMPLTESQVQASHRYFRQGQVLICSNGLTFSARPFIFYREDGAGHTTRLCMFRRASGSIPNRHIEYEVVGESVRYEEDRLVFKNELDELRGLFELGPD
jgi:hypothetical protein